MLIEELIRLGRPLLEEDADPQEVLRLITGVEDERVKNFYRHVFVVEVPPGGQGEPRALPMQEFGEVDADGDFHVDQQRAVGAAFVLPSGGNPLSPQGRYGLPVYPCYDPHLRAFGESAAGVLDFLNSRLKRTTGFTVSEQEAARIARVLHEQIAQSDFGSAKRLLGVVILARWGQEDFYAIAEGGRADRIGNTKDGRAIVPNYGRILDGMWVAKEEEGREAGARIGACSFTGKEGEVVSAYCKAWPWALPTWTCPLPHGGDDTLLVEGIGLSPLTYRALTVGACTFNKLARPVASLVIREIFCPADTRTGKEQAQRKKQQSAAEKIHGSAFLLPVQDRILEDPDRRYEFTRGIRGMLNARPDDPTWPDRHIATVTGFDVALPPNWSDLKDYRLTLVYFSGDYTRGDVHLRAFVQDVIPSTLSQLRDLARSEARAAMALLRVLMPAMSEKQTAYFARCYGSVPYLLARAYGGAYLWQQLEAVLHRRPLQARRVTANAARRIQSLVPQWPDSRYALFDEVGFHLNFLNFLGRVNRELARNPEDPAMPMRSWKQLLEMVDRGPVADLALTDVPELGFACGALIKRFSRAYYKASKKVGKRDADYLRERVLTFGSDLRPAAVHDKGLRMILELPTRLKDLRRSPDLEERVGAAIVAFQQLRDRIEKNKDEFVTAFWAGYALQGYDRPRKIKTAAAEPTVQTTGG